MARLSDNALVAAVARMARSEREASASLVAHLAELWARRLHERAGYASLFTCCVAVLHHSESEAYDRMKAAKVARRYPEALGLLASGRVSLTTLRLLAPHLTRDNHDELFSATAGKTKRDVQRILAQRFPLPPVPTSVRKLPAPRVAPASSTVPATGTLTGPRPPIEYPQAALPTAAVCAQTAVRPVLQPLATDRFRVTFTANSTTCETLEMARDLLRHAIPNGDAAQIFARALEALVEVLVREKFAATDRARLSRGQADDSRNIPAEVQRKVYLRDRGRPTVENISLRCRAHNQYEAAVYFGSGVAREAGATYGCVMPPTFSFRNENVSRHPRST